MLRRDLPTAAAALATNDTDLTICIACGRGWTRLTTIDLGGGLGRAALCVDYRACIANQPKVSW